MSRGPDVSLGLHGHLQVDEGDVDLLPADEGGRFATAPGLQASNAHGVQQPWKLRGRNALAPAAREQQVQPGSGGRVGRGWMVGMEGHHPDPGTRSVPNVRRGVHADRPGERGWAGWRRPRLDGPERGPTATGAGFERPPARSGSARPAARGPRIEPPRAPSGRERPGDAANLARGGRLAPPGRSPSRYRPRPSHPSSGSRSMEPQSIATLLQTAAEMIGRKVRIQGWVRTR